LLGDHDEQADGVRGIPSLPELPARGPGGDIIGRTAGLLVDLAVDLQPAGWRFVDRPGRDAARTAAFWGEDLDELAAAFDGYAGPLKVAVAGPFTPRGRTFGCIAANAPSSIRVPPATCPSHSPRDCAPCWSD
jgi:hypothetical protein